MESRPILLVNLLREDGTVVVYGEAAMPCADSAGVFETLPVNIVAFDETEVVGLQVIGGGKFSVRDFKKCPHNALHFHFRAEEVLGE